LHEKGRPPHAALRYQPPDPATHLVVLQFKVRLTSEAHGGALKEHVLPPLRATLQITFDPKATPNARIVIKDARFVASGSASSPLPTTAHEQLSSLKGASATAHFTDTGWTVSEQFDLASNVGAEVAQIAVSVRHAAELLIPPLPAQPVGIGATWSAASKETTAGLAVDQSIRYELISREQTTGVMHASIRTQAAPQPAQLPGSAPSDPPGELSEFEGTGNADIAFDLEAGIPLTVSVTTNQTAIYWSSAPKKLLRAKSYVAMTAERM